MAVEAKRGCGYRKVGGLYLVDDGEGRACCKMPIELSVCPCCGGGIKQTRGWTWVDAGRLFPSTPCSSGLVEKLACPAATPALMGRVGLLWIGEKFYPRPVDFLTEASKLGISRRLSAVPREYRAGETWVLFAHPKAVEKPRTVAQWGATTDWSIIDPITLEPIDGETVPSGRDAKAKALERAAALDLAEPRFVPGVIRIARPRGFEKIVKQSDFDRAFSDVVDSKDGEMRAQWEADGKRGVRWIPVPDDDPDHRGTVYDKEETGKEDVEVE